MPERPTTSPSGAQVPTDGADKRATDTALTPPVRHAPPSDPPLSMSNPPPNKSMPPGELGRTKSSAPDPLIGRTINDRFKITGLIARGGMGKVYRAEQSPL